MWNSYFIIFLGAPKSICWVVTLTLCAQSSESLEWHLHQCNHRKQCFVASETLQIHCQKSFEFSHLQARTHFAPKFCVKFFASYLYAALRFPAIPKFLVDFFNDLLILISQPLEIVSSSLKSFSLFPGFEPTSLGVSFDLFSSEFCR